MRLPTLALALALLLTTLVLAACGGTSEDTTEPSPPESPQTEAAPQPAAPPPEPPSQPTDTTPTPEPEPAPPQEEPPPPDQPEEPAPPADPEPEPTPEPAPRPDPQPFPDDVVLAFSSFEGDVWVATADGQTHQVTFGLHAATPLDWSPDRSQLLVSGSFDVPDFPDFGEQDLYLVNGLAVEPIPLPVTSQGLFHASYAPGGRHVAYRAGNTFTFLSLDGSPPPLPPSSSSAISSPAPVGRRTAHACCSPFPHLHRRLDST